MFARTNMGQSMPTVRMVKQYRTAANHGTSLSAMVNLVCGDFMEDDDDYDMFLAEAQAWYRRFDGQEIEFIFNTWPLKRQVWLATEVA
jgi:hypothetical protein